MRRRSDLFAALFAIASLSAAGAAAQDQSLNDYPTAARADYVFGCMATNGQSRMALEQCACSVDHIASVLTYDYYVKAETILRTLQVTGERVAAFRGSARHKAIVDDLRRAQAEADVLCF
ncbi:MAG: hypothetical protein AAF360_14430 [Pseudomonadota bacterium]